MVATKPVDLRRGADSLAALTRKKLNYDGMIFIFEVGGSTKNPGLSRWLARIYLA